MKIYRSVIPPHLAVSIIGLPLFIIALSIYFSVTVSVRVGLVLFLFAMLDGVLIALFFFPHIYTLDDEKLIIRNGVIIQTVPLSKIWHVEKCSSRRFRRFALFTSFDNWVRIITNNREYLVTPKDRDAFITDVENRMRGTCADADRKQSNGNAG